MQVAATAMNEASSRSHTIIQIHVSRTRTAAEGGRSVGGSNCTTSTLLLIDLAGSISANGHIKATDFGLSCVGIIDRADDLVNVLNMMYAHFMCPLLHCAACAQQNPACVCMPMSLFHLHTAAMLMRHTFVNVCPQFLHHFV